MLRSDNPVRRQRHQKGNLFEKCGAFYIRYYTRIGGVLKQKTKKLCAKDEKHHSKTCTPVRLLVDEFMLGVNSNNDAEGAAVSEFWAGTYLPFAEKNLRPTTVE